ncbi:hypothetical protein [Rhizobacter sp. LjRoot28]|uniref:hypothetical protein n=1 Tax=Rhizobacter sp. LjRoot28 TaxID=3342309 RepID=UPI003ECFF511
MVEGVFHLLAELVPVGLAYTGRAVVKATRVGRWRAVCLNGSEDSVYGMAGALSFKRDGERVITRLGLTFVGGSFYALMALAVIGLMS